ncbi:hypothetical protein MesoLj131b_77400 (plasmid) [Mesorhizobium sp. 131-2-5]|uniref:hypothetical protein n=1 Tax=Mesorhizobium sp. 131-2-5 TaxID=2744519 RepID=UPI001928C567|nr:hypothetical protein [Mesorhizobium sp. 131-2-5]BCH05741.1 hypothetical protein MesoLj131b_77400 [Mesorhizobium sp. 131-2-5]
MLESGPSAPESMGGPPDPPDFEVEIAAYVASLKTLHDKLDESQISETDVELGLHQLEALKAFTWGGLDPMVRFCVPRLLTHGPAMHPDHMKDCLEVACDEYVVKGHRLIIRRFLQGRSVSLTDLAREVFNPKSPEFGDFRKRLKENVLYPMRDIGLWDYVERELKKSRNGNDYHPGFDITAGPVLKKFHRYIYMPWGLRHAKVGCKLLAKMEN